MDARLMPDSHLILLKKKGSHESEGLARIRHVETIDLLESMGVRVVGAGAALVIEAGAALVIETTVDTTSLQSGIDDHVVGTRNLLETKVSIETLQQKRVIAEIVMQMVTTDHQVMYKKDLLEATGTLLVGKAGMIITTVLQLTVDVIKETGTIVLCHLPKTCEGLLVERIGMVHFVKHQFAKIAVDLLLPKICEGLLVHTFGMKDATVQLETVAMT